MSDQVMQALKLANESRLAKSDARRKIERAGGTRMGMLLAAEVLEQRPAYLKNTRVIDVLRWPRYAHPQAARRYLAHAGASEYRTVGELTDRQLQALVMALRSPALLVAA